MGRVAAYRDNENGLACASHDCARHDCARHKRDPSLLLNARFLLKSGFLLSVQLTAVGPHLTARKLAGLEPGSRRAGATLLFRGGKGGH